MPFAAFFNKQRNKISDPVFRKIAHTQSSLVMHFRGSRWRLHTYYDRTRCSWFVLAGAGLCG